MIEVDKTHGLIAAPHTPMDAGGEVRLELIEAQADLLARNGVAGAFVCGTTGEGLSLTMAERRAVAERWVRAAAEGFRVIVHVGHTALPAARELAAHAQKIGAFAIGTLPPIFFKPPGVAELVVFSSRVAAAAPELPFYYYHIPAMTGVVLPMQDYLAAASEAIPNAAGVKFTHEDLADYAACLALGGGRLDCLFGRDEVLLSALALGAEGAIGSTYNFAAPLYLRLIEAFRAGDLATARRLQATSMAIIRAVQRQGPGVVGFKHVMAMIGLDVGPVRPPLRPLGDEQVRALRAELEEIGFFEVCST
jgi:N-acetylneuraminate lyase